MKMPVACQDKGRVRSPWRSVVGQAGGTDPDTGGVPRDVWHVSIRVASPREFLPPLGEG